MLLLNKKYTPRDSRSTAEAGENKKTTSGRLRRRSLGMKLDLKKPRSSPTLEVPERVPGNGNTYADYLQRERGEKRTG